MTMAMMTIGLTRPPNYLLTPTLLALAVLAVTAMAAAMVALGLAMETAMGLLATLKVVMPQQLGPLLLGSG